MIVQRRDFLFTLMSAPLVLAYGCSSKNPLSLTADKATPNASPKTTPATKAAQNVVNHNADGRAFVIEGQTLIVSLTFPDTIGKLVGGLPVQIQPESAGGDQLTEPQPVYFYNRADGRSFLTILSAPLDVVEDEYKLWLTGTTQAGEEFNHELPYSARQGTYRATNLTLDKGYSDPSPEVQERTRNDLETMSRIYKERTPKTWQQPFMQPVDGGDKNNFGDKRTVNQTKRIRHAGLDYHATMGTPIRAVNDGKVALSGEQWVPGQTICLDHGGGVFSKYLHLSERHVNEGDVVHRGDIIGLSGNSGSQKVAPHLHLDLVVNGARVDPKFFMNMSGLFLKLEKE